MKKLFAAFAMVAFLIIFLPIDSHAVENSGINVCVDGEEIDFNSTGQEPISEGGRILVPFRQIFELLGYTVTYDAVNKGATVSKGDLSVTIWQGRTDFLVVKKGIEETRQLDVAAKTTSAGRFVLPIRAVCEALEMDVEWNQDYECVFLFSNDESKTNKELLIEKAKPILNPVQYKKDNALFSIVTSDGNGFIDKTGKVIIPSTKGVADVFDSEGYILKCDNETGLYGYIDRTGNYVIKPQFVYPTSSFYNGVAVVVFAENKIEKTLDVVQPDGSISHGWSSSEIFSAIDNKGNRMFDYPEGVIPSNFSDGFSVVAIPSTEVKNEFVYNYVDKTGKLINSEKYDQCLDFSEGRGIVSKRINGKTCRGAIDETGKLVVPFKSVASPGSYFEGLAVAAISNGKDKAGNPLFKYGFVDKMGNWVIKPIYDGALHFSEGLAAVVIDDGTRLKGRELSRVGRLMFIDKTGKVVISMPPGYVITESNGCGLFFDGIAQVIKTGESYYEGFQYIDKKGNLITNEVFGDSSRACENGLIRVTEKEELGSLPFKYIDKKGNVVYENPYPTE